MNVRNLLLRAPEQVVNIPEAIQLILGDGVPTDISLQLKVRNFAISFILAY